MKPPDEELLRRAAKGDAPAFEELVERYQALVLRTAARYLRDPSEVEDIAQDVFLRVYRAASSFREQAKFRTWLFRIVVNRCLERKRKRAPELGTPLHRVAAPERGREPDEEREKLRAAVDRLPPRQRLAVILRRYEGFTYAEIAEIMEVSTGTVEQHLNLAYRNLRGVLGRGISIRS